MVDFWTPGLFLCSFFTLGSSHYARNVFNSNSEKIVNYYPKYHSRQVNSIKNSPVLRPQGSVYCQKLAFKRQVISWAWVIGFDSRAIPNKTITQGEYHAKKTYSIWIKNKKVIQKINWVDKLETSSIIEIYSAVHVSWNFQFFRKIFF